MAESNFKLIVFKKKFGIKMSLENLFKAKKFVALFVSFKNCRKH